MSAEAGERGLPTRHEPTAAALAVMRAARPAQEAADPRFGAYSISDAAADLDRQVSKVRGAASRAASMRTGVEAHDRPFRVLVDVGHEEWADYTALWEAADVGLLSLLTEVVALWDSDTFGPQEDRTLEGFMEQAVDFGRRYDDLKARVRAAVQGGTDALEP